MRHTLMLALVLSACLMPFCVSADTCTDFSPAYEMRGIWFNASAMPKDEAGLRELVRYYHASNINVLFPEIIRRGYTVYPSELLTRDPEFAGTCDVLAVIIDEAHKLGMEVHPWVWVFRAGYTQDKGAILTAHPDWAELDRNGKELSANGGRWLSPANDEVRDFLESLYKELITNYDVDGLHLDYIRYEVESPSPYGYSPVSVEKFVDRYTIDPHDIGRLSYNKYMWNRWRERNITSFVQRIYLMVKHYKPDALVSAAVGYDIDWSRTTLMQNWANWVENKWIDFLTPMTYTDTTAKFRDRVEKQLATVGPQTFLAPGIGLHLQKDKLNVTMDQVAETRRLATGGQTMFASSYFDDTQKDALNESAYSAPSKLALRDIDNAIDYFKKTDNDACCDYFSRRAERLAAYRDFWRADTPYVAPTNPPLDIPDVVIPVPTVEVPKVSGKFTIDGQLSENMWKQAAKVQLEYTNEGNKASVITTALLACDDDNLYVGFNCREPEMDKIKAKVDKRDGPVFYDDSVEVFIGPYDQKEADYYHLSTNTLGTQFDQKVFSPSVNLDWQSAAQVEDTFYSVEFALPLGEVLASDYTNKKVRLNLTRNRMVTGTPEYINWSVVYGSFHSPDRFGEATLGR